MVKSSLYKVYKKDTFPPEDSGLLIEAAIEKDGGGKVVIDILERRINTAKIKLAQLEKAIREAEFKTGDLEKYVTDKANAKAEDIIEAARGKAEEIIKDAEKKKDEIDKEAYNEGFKKGEREGFMNGQQAIKRLASHLESVLLEAQARRDDILIYSEEDIVSLAFMIAKKIIKSEATSIEKKVVIANVMEGLQKVKEQESITIRINISDLKVVSSYKDEFLKMVSGLRQINFKDDSTIEPGGCKIDMSYGTVDLSIPTQLEELSRQMGVTVKGG